MEQLGASFLSQTCRLYHRLGVGRACSWPLIGGCVLRCERCAGGSNAFGTGSPPKSRFLGLAPPTACPHTQTRPATLCQYSSQVQILIINVPVPWDAWFVETQSLRLAQAETVFALPWRSRPSYLSIQQSLEISRPVDDVFITGFSAPLFFMRTVCQQAADTWPGSLWPMRRHTSTISCQLVASGAKPRVLPTMIRAC